MKIRFRHASHQLAHVGAMSFLLLASIVGASAAETWKVGDKVDAWNVAWYPAAIVALGTGDHAGYFLVHFDGFSTEQWVAAKNIRARPVAKSAAEKAAELAAGPRLGKYLVYSYGAPPNRVFLGEIELQADGHYRALQPGGKLLGEGSCRFDAPTNTVLWLSGPYQKPEWGGAFEISREGKTHTIRLRRGTIATNSIE